MKYLYRWTSKETTQLLLTTDIEWILEFVMEWLDRNFLYNMFVTEKPLEEEEP
jgi:hypothetical protein